MGRHRHRVDPRRIAQRFLPLDVDFRAQCGRTLRALQDQAVRRLVIRKFHRLAEQAVIVDDAARFETTGSREDQRGLCIVDAYSEFTRGKSAEHDRVDCAESRASEHREHGLGHHRHVDDDAIACFDAEATQRTSESGHLIQQLRITDAPFAVRHGADVNQRGVLTTPGGNVPIDRVFAGVEFAVAEPATVRRVAQITAHGRCSSPMQRLRSFEPEALRLGAPAFVFLQLTIHGT